MATFSDRLRLTLQEFGENIDTWGLVANAQVFTFLEEAICGVTTVPVAATNVVLTANTGATDEARFGILNVAGTLSANVEIIIPNVQKKYTVYNGTSGDFTLGIRTAGGSATLIQQGLTFDVWCNGSDVVRPVGLTSAGDVAGEVNTSVEAHNASLSAHYPATDSQRGFVELATDAEVQAGADTGRVVTPAGLASLTATIARRGLVELATNTETVTGTDTERAVTPAGLAAALAAAGLIGEGGFDVSVSSSAFEFTIPGGVLIQGGRGTSINGPGLVEESQSFNSPFSASPMIFLTFERDPSVENNNCFALVEEDSITVSGFDYRVAERNNGSAVVGQIAWLAIGAA